MRFIVSSLSIALACALLPSAALSESTDLASTAAMVARYPRTETNATAESLARLAADIGVDLTPWTIRPDWCRKPSPADPNRGVWSAMSEYLQAVLKRPESSDPPPPLLADFLAARRASLESIRDLLLRESPPRWALDIESWWTGPQPSRHLPRLRSLLLAEALAAVDSGDSTTGLGWLEAERKLDEGRRSWPGSWWPGDSVALAIVRRLERPSDLWSERVARYDPRVEVRAGQLVEAWTALQVLGRDTAPLTDYLDCMSEDPEPAWVEGVRRFVLTSSPVRAYGRAGTVEATARLRVLLDRLARLDPCELMAGDYPGSLAGSNPWWNRMSDLLFVEQHSVWGSVGRAMLEAELTAKVLEARRLRATGGAWPESIPGIEVSECKRGSWRYSAPGGGGMLLEFVSDGDLRFLREPGPLRFRSPKGGATPGSRTIR